MLVRIVVFARCSSLVDVGSRRPGAAAVMGVASKAMGADNVNAIAYIGRARTGAFGQSKSIGDPMGAVNVTSVAEYRRVINFAKPDAMTALVSRATGTTHPPMVPGGPVPMPGTLNQTITAAQAAASWAQALNIWTSPWGFLKVAAANNATVRQQGGQQIVSFSPAGFTSPSGSSYTLTGYISNQNLVTKVETRVDHAVVGDLLVEFEYSGYQNMNGVQVPTRIVQRQAGLQTFEATIESATPNPPTLAELLARHRPQARRHRRRAAVTGRAARRAHRRRGLQDRRQLHVAGRRHGRSRARRRKRAERCARDGGDGGGQAGDSEQADPVRRQFASALRSCKRTCRGRCGGRHHPDASQQRAGSRAASVGQPLAHR